MTFRDAQELDEGRRSLFGRWLTDELRGRVKDLRDSASRLVPSSQLEENERKDMLAQSNVLEDLITQIPLKISEELKKSKPKEISYE